MSPSSSFRALLAASLALAGCKPASRPLEIVAPAQLRSALTGSALCDRLDVLLTLDTPGDLAAPAIDGAKLVRVEGAPCTWALDSDRMVRAGTYDLAVRFVTAGAFGSCSGPILAGMYVVRGLTLPLPQGFAGLTDADFLSEVADAADPRLAGEAVSFDEDGDGAANLAELRAGSNPCPWTEPPKVELTLAGPAPTEGVSGTQLTVRTTQPQDAPYRVVLSLQHANPGYQTAKAEVTLLTDGSAPAAVTPQPSQLSWREQWRLSVGPMQDDGAGGRSWTVDFTPDEPFVGLLVAEARAMDQANVVATSGALRFSVATDPALDLPLVLALGPGEDADTPLDALVPVQGFDFAEAAAGTARFRIGDRDVGSPSSAWAPALAPLGPEGLTLALDGRVGTLAWSPDNDQWLASPLRQDLVLSDADGAKGQVTLALSVRPPVNDPPAVVPPAPRFLALPDVVKGATFDQAMLPLSVEDPDEVDAAPTCEVVQVVVTSKTACTPFSQVLCAQSGQPSDRPASPWGHGARSWPFTVTLVPGPGYAACGSKPTFMLELKVTDTAPEGASNGARSSNAGISLRTLDAVDVSPLAGLPESEGAVVDGAVPDGAGGTVGRAVLLGNGTSIVELTGPSAGLLKTFAVNLLGRGSALDRVNHRVVFENDGLEVFDLEATTTRTIDRSTLCGGASVTSDPAADPVSGNVYVLCELSSNHDVKVVELAADGSLARFSTGRTVPSLGALALVRAKGASPEGTAWLVAPAGGATYLAVDLSAPPSAPRTLVLTDPAGAGSVDRQIVDEARGSVIYLRLGTGTSVLLERISFNPDPVFDTALDLGNTVYLSNRQLVLRRPSRSGSSPAPHLLVNLDSDGGVIFYPMYWIDLDTWLIAAQASSEDFVQEGSPAFWHVPDRRYFASTPTYGTKFWLYGFADYGRLPPVMFDSNVARPWQIDSSDEGNLSVVTYAGTTIDVVTFTEAALGLDE